MALETVLVALGAGDTDRIDRIIDTVIDVAGPAGAHVVLAHVFSDEEFVNLAERMDFQPGDASPDEVATRHRVVRDGGGDLEGAGIDFEVRGGVGEKGTRIVELAGEVDADLVVVGGRRRSPTGKAVFGSTAQQVLLESPCPVTFVRAG